IGSDEDKPTCLIRSTQKTTRESADSNAQDEGAPSKFFHGDNFTAGLPGSALQFLALPRSNISSLFRNPRRIFMHNWTLHSCFFRSVRLKYVANKSLPATHATDPPAAPVPLSRPVISVGHRSRRHLAGILQPQSADIPFVTGRVLYSPPDMLWHRVPGLSGPFATWLQSYSLTYGFGRLHTQA